MSKIVNLEEVKKAAEAAKTTIEDLANSSGRPVRLYFHWSAGHYFSIFDDYHFNIDGNAAIHMAEDLAEVKAHTWKRNTGAVGLSVCAGYLARSINDLGPEPPTEAQIDVMAQVAAVLCTVWEIEPDKDHLLTHAEAADIDGYGPNCTNVERWDLYVLREGAEAKSGGDELRKMIREYMEGDALNWLFAE